MKIVNMHDAKSNLSKLVEGARTGEPFVIARAGTPLVKVTALEGRRPRRTGFLAGQGTIPDDFDTMGAAEIREMFEG